MIEEGKEQSGKILSSKDLALELTTHYEQKRTSPTSLMRDIIEALEKGSLEYARGLCNETDKIDLRKDERAVILLVQNLFVDPITGDKIKHPWSSLERLRGKSIVDHIMELTGDIPQRYWLKSSLFDKSEGSFNISSRIEDRELARLSNFEHSPFELDGERYESVEAFIQALKFSEPVDQERISREWGGVAKREGKVVKDLIKQGFTEGVGYVTNYQGIQIPYRSEAHYDLIARALRAKFTQNPDCRRALLNTGKKLITHDLGYPESPTTSLPAEVFTTILMTIRKEYQNQFIK